MSKYVAEWEKLKTAFTSKHGARPKETVRKAVIGTVSKSTGITTALKEVDSALEKKQRKPLDQAINKFDVSRNTYATFLAEEQTNFQDDPEYWKGLQNLIVGLHNILDAAQKDAEKLQSEKSGVDVPFLGIEGEFKNVLVTAKKWLEPHKAIEKKLGLLARGGATTQTAELYTKKAARAEVTEARKALEQFQSDCAKFAKVFEEAAKSQTDKDFQEVAKRIQKNLKDLSTAPRVTTQVTNLKKLELAG